MAYKGFDSEDDFNLDGLEINSGTETGFEAVENDDEQENTAEASSGKRATRKTSMTAIICGIGVVVLAVVIVGVFSKLSDKKIEANKNKATVDEQVEQQVETVVEPPQKVDLGGKNTSTSQPDTKPNTSSDAKVDSNNGWIEFSTDDSITFKDERVALTFTITKVSHYVKVVDSNSNLMVKSVLTGALSGLSGTYEIEVPYTVASKVNPGDFFDVTVEMGTDTRGKTVVGEILY